MSKSSSRRTNGWQVRACGSRFSPAKGRCGRRSTPAPQPTWCGCWCRPATTTGSYTAGDGQTAVPTVAGRLNHTAAVCWASLRAP